MARYMREIFKEKLDVTFDPALPELPSPAALKNKILVKVLGIALLA